MKIYYYNNLAFPNTCATNIEYVKESNILLSGITVKNEWSLEQKNNYIKDELRFQYKRIGKENIENLKISKHNDNSISEYYTITADILNKIYYTEIKENDLYHFIKILKPHYAISYKKDPLLNKEAFWIS